jgi:hypothetical protein
MPISFDNVAIFSAGGALGYFARTFIDHRLAKSRTDEDRKIKEFNQAAATFRSQILSELEGLYPVRQGWSREDYARFKQTIPRVETIAQEFRFHLERKKEFDTATHAYCNHCKKITWEQCTAWTLYPTMRKEGEMSPRDKFDHCVKSLLSFAEGK